MVKLQNHQKYPVEFIKNNKGLIIFHSVGSGKTITSIVAMYQFNKDILIIGPKSSKKAFLDEIDKLKFDQTRFTVYSLTKIKVLMYKDPEIFNNKCVIIDEAHHLRNQTKNNIYLTELLQQSYRLLLLTATPIINYPNDLSVLVNTINGNDALPVQRELFDFFYLDADKENVSNKDLLVNKLRNAISFYEQIDNKNYPRSKTIDIKINMSNEQVEEYKNYVKKLLGKEDIFIDFEYIDNRKKNSFLNATRQLSNTIDGATDTPKVEKLYETISKAIKNKQYPVVVYSNYLKNGIFPIAKLLHSGNISFKMITGKISDDKVIKTVNEYNNGKIMVLLLSSAGSESLDLKNTKQIHIMEPHWNESKIRQVIGRAIRYKSHNSLPEKDRFVEIYRWISIFPKDIAKEILSADQYLINISNNKDKVNNIIKEIIKEVSIENMKGGFYKYLKYEYKYNVLSNIFPK